MQLLHVGWSGHRSRCSLARKESRHALYRLTLPLSDHRLIHAMLRRQCRQRLLIPDRLQCDPRLGLTPIPFSRNLAYKPALYLVGL